MNAQARDYRRELWHDINLIGENFYIDPEEKPIDNLVIPHWNTTLMALSYVLETNPLLIGEPGSAKTTAAKVISSIMSGYPFDLYESAQIQGHPDQTYETMLARLDFSKLQTEEAVIWLASAYLPIRIIDEINRLQTGNQDELLNTLETGRFNYLNATFFSGKSPFFATANNPDDGNHILIPPLRDRFTIHLELGYIGASYRSRIRDAQANIEEALKSVETTEAIYEIINNKSYSVKERLEKIQKLASEFGQKLSSNPTIEAKIFQPSDRKAVQQQIAAIPLSTEAEAFLWMIDSELNFTPTFGRKRSNDPVDDSNHAQGLASTNVQNCLSPRAVIRGVEEYAKGIVYLTGAREVTKHHLLAIAPHVLGHRLDFTDDFKSQHETSKREGMYGCTREMHLAQELVKGIEANYGKVKSDLDVLIAAHKGFTVPETARERVENLIKDADTIDTPLIREFAQHIKSEREIKENVALLAAVERYLQAPTPQNPIDDSQRAKLEQLVSSADFLPDERLRVKAQAVRQHVEYGLSMLTVVETFVKNRTGENPLANEAQKRIIASLVQNADYLPDTRLREKAQAVRKLFPKRQA